MTWVRRVLVLLLAVALAGVLAACGDDDGGSDAGGGSGTDTADATYTADDTTIRAEAGETFAVDLPGNITTGYSWELTGEPGPAVVLENSDYEPESGAEQPLGSGGTFRFVFRAAEAGSATLAFQYVRPWEQGAAPADTASFTVTVA